MGVEAVRSPAGEVGEALPLRKPVNAVVEKQDLQVRIASQHVVEMTGADAQAVAVSRDYPDIKIRSGHFQSRRDRRGAAMDSVEPVGIDVVGEPGCTADPGDERGLVRLRACLRQRLPYCLQDGVITASGAPAHLLARIKVLGVADRTHGCDAPSIAELISRARKGCPSTLQSGMTRARVAPRSSDASCPMFNSGRRMLS